MVIKLSIKRGFTLLELIAYIVIVAIVFQTTNMFLASFMGHYHNFITEANLIDSTNLTLKKMEFDLQRAIPNSIRVRASSGLVGIEMINNIRTFTYVQGNFNIVLDLAANSLNNSSYSLITNEDSMEDLLEETRIINPQFYNSSNYTNATNANTLSLQNDGMRIHVTDGPTSYICDYNAKTIIKYQNYTISNTQPLSFSSATSSLLAKNVVACDFDYVREDNAKYSAGLVMLNVTFENGSNTVQLLRQVDTK